LVKLTCKRRRDVTFLQSLGTCMRQRQEFWGENLVSIFHRFICA
jgi:hypothetical protein